MLVGQTFGDIAKAFRAEGVTGEELVPFLGSHEVLTKFLSDCNIKVLPFAAIKLHYKLTRPFAGAVSPRVLQMLVSTCGGEPQCALALPRGASLLRGRQRPHVCHCFGNAPGKANVQLAELLRVNGVTGPDIAENLSNHKDLADFCSTLNVELARLSCMLAFAEAGRPSFFTDHGVTVSATPAGMLVASLNSGRANCTIG